MQPISKREHGLYWVCRNDAWYVAEWKIGRMGGNWWEVLGLPGTYDDHHFAKIGDQVLPQHFDTVITGYLDILKRDFIRRNNATRRYIFAGMALVLTSMLISLVDIVLLIIKK